MKTNITPAGESNLSTIKQSNLTTFRAGGNENEGILVARYNDQRPLHNRFRERKNAISNNEEPTPIKYAKHSLIKLDRIKLL